MAKIIGQGGDISVSSTAYHVSEWSLAVSNDVQDVTDTGSNGWVSRIPGVSSGELTFRAWWGGSATALTTTFAVGTKVTASLTEGTSGGTVSGAFYISGFTITNNSKTAVEFQATGQSDGAVTFS
jgi:predicted secreted protein